MSSPPSPQPSTSTNDPDGELKSPGPYALRQRRPPLTDANSINDEASPASEEGSSPLSSAEGSVHEQQSSGSEDTDDAYEEELELNKKKKGGRKAAQTKRSNSATVQKSGPAPPGPGRTHSLPASSSSAVRNLPPRHATLPFSSSDHGSPALAFPSGLAQKAKSKRLSTFKPPNTPHLSAMYWKNTEFIERSRVDAGPDDRYQQLSQQEIESSIKRLPTRKHRSALCLTMNRYTAFCASPKLNIPTFPITPAKVAIFLIRATDTSTGAMFRAIMPQPSTYPLPLANGLDSTPLNKEEGEFVTRELVTSWAEALGYAQAATRSVWVQLDLSLVTQGDMNKDPSVKEVISCFEPLASFREYASGASSFGSVVAEKGKRKATVDEDGEGSKKKTKWVKGGKPVEAPKTKGSVSPPATTPSGSSHGQSGPTSLPPISSLPELPSSYNGNGAWPPPQSQYFQPPPPGYGMSMPPPAHAFPPQYHPPSQYQFAPNQWQQSQQQQAYLQQHSQAASQGQSASSNGALSGEASGSSISTPNFAYPILPAKSVPVLQLQTHTSPMLSALEPSPISGTGVMSPKDHPFSQFHHGGSPTLPSLTLSDERLQAQDERKEESAAALLAMKGMVNGLGGTPPNQSAAMSDSAGTRAETSSQFQNNSINSTTSRLSAEPETSVSVSAQLVSTGNMDDERDRMPPPPRPLSQQGTSPPSILANHGNRANGGIDKEAHFVKPSTVNRRQPTQSPIPSLETSHPPPSPTSTPAQQPPPPSVRKRASQHHRSPSATNGSTMLPPPYPSMAQPQSYPQMYVNQPQPPPPPPNSQGVGAYWSGSSGAGLSNYYQQQPGGYPPQYPNSGGYGYHPGHSPYPPQNSAYGPPPPSNGYSSMPPHSASTSNPMMFPQNPMASHNTAYPGPPHHQSYGVPASSGSLQQPQPLEFGMMQAPPPQHQQQNLSYGYPPHSQQMAYPPPPVNAGSYQPQIWQMQAAQNTNQYGGHPAN